MVDIGQWGRLAMVEARWFGSSLIPKEAKVFVLKKKTKSHHVDFVIIT